MAGNGVAVDTEVFREEIEVGANIVPIEPILPEINKTIRTGKQRKQQQNVGSASPFSLL